MAITTPDSGQGTGADRSFVRWWPQRLWPQRLWPQLTAFLLIGIELCWIVPWYRTVIEISYVASPLRAALVLGGVMLIAYLSAQAMESVRLVPAVRQSLLGMAFAACLVGGGRVLLNTPLVSVVGGLVDLDPGAVLVVFAVLWLWWRGTSLAREPIRPLVVWRRFVLGLYLFIAHVFIVTRMRDELLASSPGLGLFTVFLFISLWAMVFARVSYVSLSRGVRKNPFDRRWLATTFLVVGPVMAVAVILGGLLSGQYTYLLDQLGEGLKWALLAIVFVASLPWLLLSYLFGPLLPLLRQAIPTVTPTPVGTQEPFAAPANPPQLRPVEPVPLSPGMQMVIFWGMVLVLLAALFFAQRRARGRRKEGEDEAESLLGRGDALRLLRKAIRSRAQELAEQIAARLRPAQRLLAAARVRRIYAHLMDLCASLKHPRPAAQTPLEFLPAMGELFPGGIADLNLITQAYVKVRYGELPESQEEIDGLEQAWKRIQAEGRRVRKSGQQELQTANVDEVRRTVL